MSKMSKIDQVHLWAVILCMSKTSKITKIFNIHRMLLMSHVGDVRDVKYFNKTSKATLYRAMLLMSEMSKISHYCEITVLRYFTSSNYIVYHNSNYSN